MRSEGLEEVIRKIEADGALRSFLGSDKPLTSGVLDDLGSLMEDGGRILVEVRLKDKGEGDSERTRAFQKLYEYIQLIDGLDLPRYVKGYIIKKLGSIATVKIRRD
jgi:hypothetical protein